MLAIIIFWNGGNHNFQKCHELELAEILGTWFSKMLAFEISRNVGNYDFPKYWQLEFPEILAVIVVRNAGDKCYQTNLEDGEECWQL